MNEQIKSEAYKHGWLVGDWLFEPCRRRLVRGQSGYMLSLPASRVLELLLQHSNRPLTREWLLEQAWNGAEVSDESLSKAISLLRRRLGDADHDLIETVHGVGYQLNGDVRPAPAAADEAPAQSPGPSRHRPALVVAAALAVLITVIVMVYQRDDLADSEYFLSAAADEPQFVNLTYRPGRETVPQLSPDGSRLTYLKAGETLKLMLARVGDSTEGEVLAEDVVATRWCPQGDHIAMLVQEGRWQYSVDIMAADGADRHTIGHTRVAGTLEWLPDHSALLFADFRGQESINIIRQSLDSPDQRGDFLPLTEPAAYLDPRISPDGRWFSYREGTFPDSRIVVLDLNDNRAVVYRGPVGQVVRSHDWSEDSHSLMIAMAWNQINGVWRLDLREAIPEPELVLPTPAPAMISVARNSGELAFSYTETVAGISVITDANPGFQERWRLNSSETERLPAIDPTGRRVAFLSDRTGSFQLWVQTLGTDEPSVLTLPGDPLDLQPAWSADGHALLSATGPQDQPTLHLVDTTTGEIESFAPPQGAVLKALALAGQPGVPLISAARKDRGPGVHIKTQSGWRTLAALDAVKLASNPSGSRILAAVSSGYGLWDIDLNGDGARQIEVPVTPLNLQRWQLVESGILMNNFNTDTGTSLQTWSLDDDPQLLEEQKFPWGDESTTLSASWQGDRIAVEHRSRTEENIQMFKPGLPTRLATR